MIQMQTMVDVADNTGAKRAMVIDVYKGGSSRRGRRRLRHAGLGDILLVTVQKALPNSDCAGGVDRMDRYKQRKAKVVGVRVASLARRA